MKNLIWQLLRALEFCHTHNVVHRDIKPENLLISANGVLKLCDFGFARTLAGPAGRYTDYVSTRWYRAPELLVGDQGYGKAVDIWAVGCLMAEIAHGLPLFPGESDLDQLSHIIWCFGKLTPRLEDLARSNPQFTGASLPQFAKLDSLQQKLEGVSQQQLDVIQQCLAYEPMQRPTCSDLLRHTFFKGSAAQFTEQLAAAMQADARDKLAGQQPRRSKRINSATHPAAGGTSASSPAGAAAADDGSHLVKPAGGGSAGSGATREQQHSSGGSSSASIASDYTSPRSDRGEEDSAFQGASAAPQADISAMQSAEAAREAAAEERLRQQLARDASPQPHQESLRRVRTVEGFGDLGGLAGHQSLSSVPSDAEDAAPPGRYGEDVRRQIASRSGMRSQQRDRQHASVAAEGRALDKDWHATAAGIRASLNETLQHEHHLRKLEADRLRLRSQGGLARTRSRGATFESGGGGGEGKHSEDHRGLDASGSTGNLAPASDSSHIVGHRRSVTGLRAQGAATGAGGGGGNGSSDDGVSGGGRWAHGSTARRAPPRTLPSMSSGEGSAGDGDLSGEERGRGGAGSAAGMAPRIVAMPMAPLVAGDSGATDSKSHAGGKTGDSSDAGGMTPLGGRFRHGLGALQGLRPLPSLNEIDDDDAGGYGKLGGARSRTSSTVHMGARGPAGAPSGLFLGGMAMHSGSGHAGGSGAAATGGGAGLRTLAGGLQPRNHAQAGGAAIRGGWQAVPTSSGLSSQGLRSQGLGGSTPSRWGASSVSRGGSGMGSSNSGMGLGAATHGQLRSHRPMALSGMGLGLSQRSQGGGGPSGSSHRFPGSSGVGISTPGGQRRAPGRAMPATPQSYSQRGRMALRGGTGLSNLRMA